jgi:hypothetical protein
MYENTDTLRFKPKERPKTTSQEKNSNFCCGHFFSMKFFLFEKQASHEGITSQILYLVSLEAQVREAK